MKHQLFDTPCRVSQSLRNDRCQNILYKSVFEHFTELKNIAALLLASKSFQNSSFGPNYILNFEVYGDSISLLESVLSPSSCLPMQFVPSLRIKQSRRHSEKVNRGVFNFVGELVNTKYLRLQLRSLSLDSVKAEVLSCFFGSSGSNSWPQLRDLALENCGVNDAVLEIISKNATQLRMVNLWGNSSITDCGLECISNISGIASLDLSYCNKITDAGFEHVSKLSGITSLHLRFCDKITDAGLEHIAKLSDCSSLNLRGCDKITNVGLEHISNLAFITSLDLARCDQITAEATKKFIMALPNCDISNDGN